MSEPTLTDPVELQSAVEACPLCQQLRRDADLFRVRHGISKPIPKCRKHAADLAALGREVE